MLRSQYAATNQQNYSKQTLRISKRKKFRVISLECSTFCTLFVQLRWICHHSNDFAAHHQATCRICAIWYDFFSLQLLSLCSLILRLYMLPFKLYDCFSFDSFSLRLTLCCVYSCLCENTCIDWCLGCSSNVQKRYRCSLFCIASSRLVQLGCLSLCSPNNHYI